MMLELYVSRRCAAMRAGDDIRTAWWSDPDPRQPPWLDWLRAAGGRCSVRCWLGSSLAMPFMLGPVPGVRSWLELQAVANVMAADSTDVPGELGIWIAEWPRDSATLAVAFDVQVRARLHTAVGRRLRFLRPWWSEVMISLKSRGKGPVVIEEPDAIVLLTGNGTLVVEGYSLSETASSDEVLRRAIATSGLGLEQCTRLQMTAFDQPRPAEEPPRSLLECVRTRTPG